MLHKNLANWLQNLRLCLGAGASGGERLSAALDITNGDTKPRHIENEVKDEEELRAYVLHELRSVLPDASRFANEREVLVKLVTSSLLAVKESNTGNAIAAHTHAVAAYNALRSTFESSWATVDAPTAAGSAPVWAQAPWGPTLRRATVALTILAIAALQAEGGDPSVSPILTKTSVALRAARNACYRYQDLLLLLSISVISYKLYFKQSNLFLPQDVASMVLPFMDDLVAAKAPAGELCTFWFFHGMFSVMRETFSEAREALTEALRLCDPAAQRNRATILSYLLPIRVLRGEMPRSEALEKIGLQYLADFMAAVYAGDAPGAHAVLDRNQLYFLRLGTYLLLEKLLVLAHRNFLRRFLEVQRACGGHEAQVRLPVVRNVLASLGLAMTVEEVECTVANLILRRMLRGYVAANVMTLVVARGPLSKAFPKVVAGML